MEAEARVTAATTPAPLVAAIRNMMIIWYRAACGVCENTDCPGAKMPWEHRKRMAESHCSAGPHEDDGLFLLRFFRQRRSHLCGVAAAENLAGHHPGDRYDAHHVHLQFHGVT